MAYKLIINTPPRLQWSQFGSLSLTHIGREFHDQFCVYFTKYNIIVS